MPRGLTEAMIEALSAPIVKLATFYEAEFASTTLRLWDGMGPIVWNGAEWQGNGWFKSYDPPTETQEIRAEGFRVQLSSVPDEVVALVLNEAQQGLSGKVWLAALDDDDAVVEDPVLVCVGKLDVPEFSETGSESVLIISYESDLIDLENPNEKRYTDAEQQRIFPSDSGFRHVAGIPEMRLFWGIPGDIPTE